MAAKLIIIIQVLPHVSCIVLIYVACNPVIINANLPGTDNFMLSAKGQILFSYMYQILKISGQVEQKLNYLCLYLERIKNFKSSQLILLPHYMNTTHIESIN